MKKWYEKYEKLNPILFTYDNSGKKLALGPPYRSRRNDNFDTIDIEGCYGMDQIFKILGYTEEPPYKAQYPCVAIMFEDLHNFEKIWWHYEID